MRLPNKGRKHGVCYTSIVVIVIIIVFVIIIIITPAASTTIHHDNRHDIAMAQVTAADLKEWPTSYDTSRNVGDVLVGEDNAHLLIEASSSGNNTALQSLLSQPQSIKAMLEEPHRIYEEDRPSQGPNDARKVMARGVSNLEWALEVAALNGQAAVVSTLLAFATDQGIDATDVVPRPTMYRIVREGNAAVLKALVSADPNFMNLDTGHGTMPLYEAVRQRHTDSVAVLLELGADPLHPVKQSKKLGTFRSSLMSFAAMAEDTRITEMLLEHNTPIAGTGALHSAACLGRLDTMRLLMQHGADVNEVLPSWSSWTPLHFAAWSGAVDAMKLLEQSGARSDMKNEDGLTPAQLPRRPKPTISE